MFIPHWMKRTGLQRPAVLGLLLAHLLLLIILIMIILNATPMIAGAKSLEAVNAAETSDYGQLKQLLPDNQAEKAQFGQGVAVSADGSTMLVSAPSENVTHGAVYVYVKSGNTWAFQTKLAGDPPAATSGLPSFGNALALSANGNTALVASSHEAGWNGAVYVYVREGTTWSRQKRITAEGGVNGDYFGSAVSISADGNTALIGGECFDDCVGAALVFVRSGSNWTQQGRFSPTEFAPGENTFFGHAVSLSADGSSAVVGAYNQGAAYIYQRNNTTWSFQKKLTKTVTNSLFGEAVAFANDGNSIVIGASGINEFRGAAYIYTKNNSTWTEQAPLTVSNLPVFSRLAKTAAWSADGNTIVFGAELQEAYVFKKTANTWNFFQKLIPTDQEPNTHYGFKVALVGSGATILLGSPGQANQVGTAYIFEVAAAPVGNYVQISKKLSDNQAEKAQFGQAVAVSADGSTMLVSAPGESEFYGAVYVYVKLGNAWNFQSKLVGDPPNNTTNFPSFGNALAISANGNTALIASRYEAGWNGAVYVYVRNGVTWSRQARLVAPGSMNGSYFGSAVSISADGNTALGGAECFDECTGAAFVFVRSGTSWTYQAKLTPTNSTSYDNSFFGHAVSLSGDGSSALVGAQNQGAAYIYQRSNTTWSLQQKLTKTESNSLFGESVAFAPGGNAILVGASGMNGFRGAAYIYTKNNTTWTEQTALTLNNLPAYTRFSKTAAWSADGNTIVFGADVDEAYVFKKTANTWNFFQKLLPRDPGARSYFGFGVALSGNGVTILIGAPSKAELVGAAYIYAIPQPEFILSVNQTSLVEGHASVFSAKLNNFTGSGTVTFTINGSTNVSPTTITENGTNFSYNSTLPIGTYVVTATFHDASGTVVLVSNSVTQEITNLCDGLLVTLATDAGDGVACGSFSRALLNAATAEVANPLISFELAETSQVTFSGPLTLNVPANVAIDGKAGVVLNGNGQSGNGLRLSGHNTLSGLTIRGFAGNELISKGQQNKFKQVTILP